MPDTFIQEQLSTPIRYNCDVLVAGGGTAGAVAALAAAKTGAQVLLVERENFLGGTLLNGAGPMHSFFNLYQAFPQAEKVQVVRGVCEEIVQRLVAEHASYGHLEQENGGDHDSTATIVDRELYKNVMFTMMKEYGVKLLLSTSIVRALTNGTELTGVIIENKSGRQAIKANVVVDCTGDGDVAAFAGAPYTNHAANQAVSMPFALANVDLKKLEAFAREKDILFTLVHADKGDPQDNIVRMGFDLCALPEFSDFMQGISDPTDKKDPKKKPQQISSNPKFTINMFGPWGVNFHPHEISYVNSNMMVGVDGTNAEEVTQAEIVLRDRCVQLTKLLRKYIPGCEHAYISWTPSYLGIRASRIIECEYDLTHEDILEARRFPDEVALYGYHDYAPHLTIRDGLYYGFPYRAFIPKKIDNLLVAGRMITSDFSAHMSTRNTAGCMVQGHAVGTAAALAALEGVHPRDLDIQLLRRTLLEQGAFLG